MPIWENRDFKNKMTVKVSLLRIQSHFVLGFDIY